MVFFSRALKGLPVHRRRGKLLTDLRKLRMKTVPKPETDAGVPELAPKTGASSAYDILVSDYYWRGEMDIPPRGQRRYRPAPKY